MGKADSHCRTPLFYAALNVHAQAQEHENIYVENGNQEQEMTKET